MAQAAGVRPIEPALGATLGASMGFMMPVSTPPNAIVYSSGYVPITAMMRYGLLLDVVGFFVIVGAGAAARAPRSSRRGAQGSCSGRTGSMPARDRAIRHPVRRPGTAVRERRGTGRRAGGRFAAAPVLAPARGVKNTPRRAIARERSWDRIGSSGLGDNELLAIVLGRAPGTPPCAPPANEVLDAVGGLRGLGRARR